MPEGEVTSLECELSLSLSAAAGMVRRRAFKSPDVQPSPTAAAAAPPLHAAAAPAEFKQGQTQPSGGRPSQSAAASACWDSGTEVGSIDPDQLPRRHNKARKQKARTSRLDAFSSSASAAPPLPATEPPIFEPYVDPAELEDAQWLTEHASDEEGADPEWESLCQTVGSLAESHMSKDEDMPLPVALLKALWSLDGIFSASLIARYQRSVADAIADPGEEMSEADWWFAEAPADTAF